MHTKEYRPRLSRFSIEDPRLKTKNESGPRNPPAGEIPRNDKVFYYILSTAQNLNVCYNVINQLPTAKCGIFINIIFIMPKKKTTAPKQFKIPLLSMEDYNEILNTDLFKLLGLEKLASKEKEAIAEKLGDIIMSRVLIRIDEQLQASDVAELKSILGNDDKGAFYKFLEEKNIDLPKIVTQEAMTLKAELTSFVLMKNKA